MKVNWPKIRVYIFLVSLAAAILFFIGTIFSMLFYPGGTLREVNTEGYNFFQNFLSDLGRTRGVTGASNAVSHIIFKVSLSCAAAALILYFLTAFFVFKDNVSRVAAFIAAFFGAGAGYFYVLIAWHPINTEFFLHNIYVRSGFLLFLVASVYYTIAIYAEAAFANIYARIFIAFCIILLLQIGIMIFGPRAWESEAALSLQVTAQKVVIFAQVFCMISQIWGVYRFQKERMDVR